MAKDLTKYIGKNFGDKFFEILDYLNIPNNVHRELYMALAELKKQGLYTDKNGIIRRK
jgi:hypothetical protein